MNIKLENVASVYSGINGRCCCGCSGKHVYASAHRDWAVKDRGYTIDDDEVNDHTVKLIVNKINKNFVEGVQNQNNDHQDDYTAVVIGKRLYVAYLKS